MSHLKKKIPLLRRRFENFVERRKSTFFSLSLKIYISPPGAVAPLASQHLAAFLAVATFFVKVT